MIKALLLQEEETFLIKGMPPEQALPFPLVRIPQNKQVVKLLYPVIRGKYLLTAGLSCIVDVSGDKYGKKIVLIGAGSAQFGSGTLGDIFQSGVLKGSEVVLHDIDAAALDAMRKKAEDALERYDLDFKVTSSLDLRASLKGLIL